MRLRKPDWAEGINTFSILNDASFEIKGEFTIPRQLGDSTSASNTEPGVYVGSLSGLVIIPKTSGENSFVTTSLDLNYDVSLDLKPGEISASSPWTFIKDWFGPTWRNLGIIAGIGVGLFLSGSFLVPKTEQEDAQADI